MPETTVMKDSHVGDAWIAEMCKLNPVQRVKDAAGNPTMNILTGPVRLVFCDSLFEAKPQMRSDPNSKKNFSTGVLFTPYTDMSLFWEDYYRICASDFQNLYNPTTQQYAVDNPFADQGAKAAQYNGFTPGLQSATLSSNFKPPVVDARGNPITDESKVYPGVWAICSVNCYASGKGKPKKGPRFGLQTLMIVGDDKTLAGGAVDPRTQFGGVNVKAPTAVAPGQFGQPVAPPVRPGVAALYPPGGNQAPPMGMRPPAPAAAVEDDYSQFN